MEQKRRRNTIGFARVFKKVLSIELNKENMEALNSNVALYDLKMFALF